MSRRPKPPREAPAETRGPRPEGGPPPAPPAPRRRAALAGVALLLAAVLGGGYLALRGGAPAAPAAPVALPAPATPPPARTVSADDFAGAEACAQCHQEQFAAWSGSTHGRAGGEPGRGRVLAAFDGTPIRFRDAVVLPEVGPGGEYRFRVSWDGLPEQVLTVDGVIGGGHMEGGGTQGFVTRHRDGTLRFLPFDFARQQGQWFCNTGTRLNRGWLPVTPELSLADCGDWPPVRVLGDGTRFATCQGCHGSQIEVSMDPAEGRYRTQMASLAINCESCHGPAARHVELARSGALATRADIGLAPLGTLGEEASLNVCFQCHALKDQLADGYLPGESLEEFYSLKYPMLGERPYTADGRVRTFAYQQTHRFADCYLSGTMTCVDCHEPHGQGYRDHQGRPLPGRFSNGQCTSCHASKAERLVEHTRHPAGSAGSQCVSCHMPYLQHPDVGAAVRYGRSDHSIPIPRPAWDAAQGVQSACAQCHADRPVEALQRQVRAWWGEPKPHKPLVTALAEARREGDALARAGELLQPDARFPMAQFGALAHLLEEGLEPDMPRLARNVEERLRALARGEDLDTRALALASLHYARGTEPGVRAFLAAELAELGEAEWPVRRRWATALGFLAERLQTAGAPGGAVAVYDRALEILPEDARLLLTRGLALSAAGDEQGAVASFRRAAAADPSQTLAWLNLGISLERTGDSRASTEAYQRALQTDPHNALAHFNLGNQMLRQRRPDLAAEYYRQAASIDPSLAPAHFNLARAYIFLGEYPRALAAVRHGLRFERNDPTALQMLRDLEATLAGP